MSESRPARLWWVRRVDWAGDKWLEYKPKRDNVKDLADPEPGIWYSDSDGLRPARDAAGKLVASLGRLSEVYAKGLDSDQVAVAWAGRQSRSGRGARGGASRDGKRAPGPDRGWAVSKRRDLSEPMKAMLRRLAQARCNGFVLLNFHAGSRRALEDRGLLEAFELTPAGWAAALPLVDDQYKEVASYMATGSFRIGSKDRFGGSEATDA